MRNLFEMRKRWFRLKNSFARSRSGPRGTSRSFGFELLLDESVVPTELELTPMVPLEFADEGRTERLWAWVTRRSVVIHTCKKKKNENEPLHEKPYAQHRYIRRIIINVVRLFDFC